MSMNQTTSGNERPHGVLSLTPSWAGSARSTPIIPEILAEVRYDNGGIFRARIPDCPILPIFNAVNDLLRKHECTMQLGLDTPMVDIHLRVYPDSVIVVDMQTAPVTLESIGPTPMPNLRAVKSTSEAVLKLIDERSGNHKPDKSTAHADLHKFLSSVSVKSVPNLLASVDLVLGTQHFWIALDEFKDEIVRLAEAIAPNLTEVTTPRETMSKSVSRIVSQFESWVESVASRGSSERDFAGR